MRAIGTIWMVARREVKARFLTKANLVSLGLLLLAVVAGVVVMDYFQNRDTDEPTFTIALAEQTAELRPGLEAAAAGQDTTLDISTMGAAEAEEAVTEDLDAYISGDPAQPEVLVADEVDGQLLGLVTGVAQAHAMGSEVAALGGDPGAVSEAVAQAAPDVRSLAEEDPSGGMFGPAYFVAILSTSVLLFALISTGALIAMGVVEEKTSRVVEILLATIRPSSLLAGKILGIGIVGLIQVVLLGGAAIGTMAATDLLADFEIDLTTAMLMIVLWFFLGFAIFALLFGGFAALVSRQEDIGSVTTPLTFLLFVPYYVAMFMVPNNPDTTLTAVLSQIPIFSPFMMPMRSAFDAVSTGELVLSVVLALATIPLLVWVASTVYQRGVLHTGGRMKLSEAFARR